MKLEINTNDQPIQTTAAVAHLRYTARRVAINERCVERQPEWLAADLIEQQSAQIERMRAALRQARGIIEEHRCALLDCHTDWQGRVDEAGTSAAQVYDAALRMIDEAIGETNDR